MKKFIFLIIIFISSCKSPYYKYDEFLIEKIYYDYDSDSTGYIRIRYKDSRIFTKDSIKSSNFGYILFEMDKSRNIPVNYSKIRKNNVLKMKLNLKKSQDGSIMMFPAEPTGEKASFYVASVFESNLIINGYLPDSCFVKR